MASLLTQAKNWLDPIWSWLESRSSTIVEEDCITAHLDRLSGEARIKVKERENKELRAWPQFQPDFTTTIRYAAFWRESNVNEHEAIPYSAGHTEKELRICLKPCNPLRLKYVIWIPRPNRRGPEGIKWASKQASRVFQPMASRGED